MTFLQLFFSHRISYYHSPIICDWLKWHNKKGGLWHADYRHQLTRKTYYHLLHEIYPTNIIVSYIYCWPWFLIDDVINKFRLHSRSCITLLQFRQTVRSTWHSPKFEEAITNTLTLSRLTFIYLSVEWSKDVSHKYLYGHWVVERK